MSSLISTTLLLVNLDKEGIDVRFSSRRGGWFAFSRQHGVLAGPLPSAVKAGEAGLSRLPTKENAAA